MKRLAPALVALLLLLPAAAAEYGNVKFERRGSTASDDVPVAYFPHWIHRMQYKCGACHEEPYKMKTGASAVTMDSIKAQESCGVCHDGKKAFEPNFDTCPRCHVK